MGITAPSGPMVVYGHGVDSNPERGPSPFFGGTAILDPRPFYTYQPGQRVGSPTMCFTSNEIEVINQVPSATAAANIAAAQVGAVHNMTLVNLNGAGITVGASVTNPNTGAPVTNLLAIDGRAQTFGFGDVGFQTIQAWDARTLIARNVVFTSVGDDHLATATVHGFDIYGFPMTETVTLGDAGTAAGKKAFKYIQSIALAGTLSGSNISAGTGDVIGFPLRTDFFGNARIVYNNAVIVASAGFTAADTTVPATATTGDVRGTYLLPSISDGTKRLQVFSVVSAFNIGRLDGLFGEIQF